MPTALESSEQQIMNIRWKILYTTVVSTLLCAVSAFAQQVSVQAVLEAQEAYVGEPIGFQIQVKGSSSPLRPDISALNSDFVVKPNGGGPQRSRSVRIINGKRSTVVKNDYIFAYTLTPKQVGAFIVPSITINVDGSQYRTQPLSVSVKKATETDDFKLRLSLSKKQCYVGEPIILNIVWYLSKDVRGFDITLPILDNDDLFFANARVDTSKGGYINVPLGGENVVAKQAHGVLDGKQYTTVSLSKVIIAKKPGNIVIEPAHIMCEALAGYKARGSSSRDQFFADFAPFGSRRREVYKRIVVPSNQLQFEVLPLPTEGRPANFAGHIGEYKVATDAAPVNVSVGDPITLHIRLSGPVYLDHIAAPDLAKQAGMVSDFKIPAEMGEGDVTTAGKLFTQTIRALNSDVTAIPAIELPYFDTKRGKYRIAKSTPIPLNVKFSKVVTAADAEGATLVVANGSAVESWSRGIAHNYGGDSLLDQAHYGVSFRAYPKMLIILILFPPLLYLMTLIVLLVFRYRENNSPAIRASKALPRLVRSVGAVSDGDISLQLLSSLQEYLGRRLNLDHGVLTFADVREELSARGVDAELLKELKGLFNECEAGHFGGGVAEDDYLVLGSKIIDLARKLEKELR